MERRVEQRWSGWVGPERVVVFQHYSELSTFEGTTMRPTTHEVYIGGRRATDDEVQRHSIPA